MSINNIPQTQYSNNSELITSYDYGKLFLFRNRFVNRTYNNSTGSAVTLSRGTVMGTILSTGYVVPQASGASDGSEFPRGILANDYTIPANSTATVSICVGGDVAQEGIILNGSDTLTTAVGSATTGGGTIQDLIMANSVDLMLVAGSDQTIPDNY